MISSTSTHDDMLAVAVLSVAIATLFRAADAAPGCGVMTPADCGADGCGESKILQHVS